MAKSLSVVAPRHEKEAGWYLIEQGSESSLPRRKSLHLPKSNIHLEVGWTVGAGRLPTCHMHTCLIYPLTWKCHQTSDWGFSWQLVHCNLLIEAF